MLFDLHCHSTASDGTLSPTDLVKRAAEKGVNVLALTDHDTLEGVAEAREAAEQHDLHLVTGVELSVTWAKQVVHIVGLNVDAEDAQLKQGLAQTAAARIDRARRIGEKMEKHGVDNALQTAIDMAGSEAVTRTHFARLLIERGHVNNMESAFKKWLGRKGKAYVAGEWADLSDAVRWIVEAGGQAVVAHPMRYNMTNTKLGEMVKEFKAAGGEGIEVATSSHNVAERAKMARLAELWELKASAGSDFHTPGNPHIELGHYLKLPDSCQPIWHDWDISQAAARAAS